MMAGTNKDADETAPDPIDDVEAAAPSPRGAPAPERQDEEQAALPEVMRDDVRDAITRRYRELRAAKSKVETDESDEPETESDEPETVAEAAPEGQTPAKAANSSEDDTEIPLMVDGKEVRKKLSEVRALAQKYVASDNRLEESKRLLAEAKAIRAGAETENQPGSERTSETPVSGKAPSQPENPPDRVGRDKLRNIAERIQLGDTEDGVAALQEVIELSIREATMARGGTPDVSRAVQETLQEERFKAEFNNGVQRFAEKYPTVAQDPDLGLAAQSAFRNEVIADLRACGIDDDDIAMFKGDIPSLMKAQRQLRLNGHKARSIDQLLDQVGTRLASKFRVEAQPSQSKSSPASPPQKLAVDPNKVQERVDRKRATQHQPRTTGARATIQEAPKPKTRADILREMRANRNYPT